MEVEGRAFGGGKKARSPYEASEGIQCLSIYLFSFTYATNRSTIRP